MGWKGVDPAVWARQAKEQMRDAFRYSVQDMADELSEGQPSATAGPGVLPEVTGNLGNSVMAQIGSMPTVKGGETKFAAPDLGAIQQLQIGDVAFIGYQAIYARRVNYGFVGVDSLGRAYNQSGRGFVEAKAAKWPQIVARAAVKARTKGGA